jgi:primosomal protein N' (replication factor Y)
MTILRLALPTPLRRLFDYLPPQQIDPAALLPGIRVQVPFQRRTLIGVLVSVEKSSSLPYEKLKRADLIIDDVPILTSEIDKLCLWASDYYHCSLGEVYASAMPTQLRKGILPPEPVVEKAGDGETAALSLNSHQQLAVEAICAAHGHFQAFLLEGVTGSGKTEVYLRAIDDMLSRGKQALVLVPEISLTPQTIARFKRRFSVQVVALHSGLSEKQRLQGWVDAKSGTAKIVIGTRSAIFTSMPQLGLIIVDEEHDQSFKQQDRFRYHARDLAIMRASMNQMPVVLGSATPSLESLLNVERQRYTYLDLPERAGGASMPAYEMIDLKSSPVTDGLSDKMIAMMRSHLAQGNQVMLFINRRGFAPVLYCTQCAWTSECKRCDARMVYHNKPPRLHCHHCDARKAVPVRCEQCQQASLEPIGIGTQRLEENLTTLFPEIPIIRVDRDSTRRKGSMQKLLDQVHEQKPAILLGTQMLAKGHHFPQVTLVGIIDIDGGLFSADFRAAEQMGQLLMQVSGRAGREEKAGTVMLQTHHPDHPLLQTLIQHGYQAFARQLLVERHQAMLPPYSHFAIFRAEAHAEKKAVDFLAMIKEWCDKQDDTISALGPVPALMQKRKGMHCQHLLLRADRRGNLQQLIKNILDKLEASTASQPVKWVLDVDPVEV